MRETKLDNAVQQLAKTYLSEFDRGASVPLPQLVGKAVIDEIAKQASKKGGEHVG